MKPLIKDNASGILYAELSAQKNPPVGEVVLLHGFGASAQDLMGLAEWIDPERSWRWLFPQGPISFSTGQGSGQIGYGWFPIDFPRMSQAYLRKDYGAIAREDPPELRQARKLITIFLNQVSLCKKQILGGFSQGGMVAIDTFFESFATRDVSALMLFSTSVVAMSRWQQKKDGTPNIPVFLSHGRADLVLPFEQAEQLQSFFSGPVSFEPFQGGHEIPRQVLAAAKTFLASCFQVQQK